MTFLAQPPECSEPSPKEPWGGSFHCELKGSHAPASHAELKQRQLELCRRRVPRLTIAGLVEGHDQDVHQAAWPWEQEAGDESRGSQSRQAWWHETSRYSPGFRTAKHGDVDELTTPSFSRGVHGVGILTPKAWQYDTKDYPPAFLLLFRPLVLFIHDFTGR